MSTDRKVLKVLSLIMLLQAIFAILGVVAYGVAASYYGLDGLVHSITQNGQGGVFAHIDALAYVFIACKGLFPLLAFATFTCGVKAANVPTRAPLAKKFSLGLLLVELALLVLSILIACTFDNIILSVITSIHILAIFIFADHVQKAAEKI